MTKHVLVVDDDPSIRDLISTAFSTPDCVVDVAETSERCLAKLRERRPDLVLLDVQMPGGDGFQTLRAIRADNTLRHVPVVMLTAKRSASDVQQAREMAVVDYLAKPINLLQLAKRVERVLQSREDTAVWEV
ncbi:MAG: response regulator [Alphaproteobacteria bacterium]|nr:response regulator [Alphaproteobacteria bacterium]